MNGPSGEEALSGREVKLFGPDLMVRQSPAEILNVNIRGDNELLSTSCKEPPVLSQRQPSGDEKTNRGAADGSGSAPTRK